MSIAKKIKQLQLSNSKDRKNDREFLNSSPLERAKQQAHSQLLLVDVYRTSILKSVSTFSGLSEEVIKEAVHSLQEKYYTKGDTIIKEGYVGDTFYILEEGWVEVTKRRETKELSAIPLAILGKNSYFGEKSLLTEEYRSASVTVTSATAKCLEMSKDVFNRLIHHSSNVNTELQGIVIEKVPLFRDFSSSDKERIISKLDPQFFMAGTYICRQGTVGDTFYIIMEGSCSVSIFDAKHGKELEVAILYPGDYFGDRALMQDDNIRTASVRAIENVNCMALNKKNFTLFFSKMKDVLKSHEAALKVRSSGLADRTKCRRVTAFDENNTISVIHAQNFVVHFLKFQAHSYWKSLYSSYYAVMLLQPKRLKDFGEHAVNLMKLEPKRLTAVQSIAEITQRICSIPPDKRSKQDLNFLLGLLRLKNKVLEKYLRDFDAVQINELALRVTFQKSAEYQRTTLASSSGTCLYLILRGAVRLFSQRRNIVSQRMELDYEEDLTSGDIFGTEVIEGVFWRQHTALTITKVDYLVIESNDYNHCKNIQNNLLTDDEKYHFLFDLALFKKWGEASLRRLAHALKQLSIEKNTVIVKKNDISPCISFIINGRVDIVGGNSKSLSSLQRGSYFGESGILNSYLNSKTIFLTERYSITALTTVKLLSLDASQWNLLDHRNTLQDLHTVYLTKIDFRQGRRQSARVEGSLVKALQDPYQQYVVSQQQQQQSGDEFSSSLSNQQQSSSIMSSTSSVANQSASQLPSIEEIPNILNEEYDKDALLLTAVKKSRREMKQLRVNISERRKVRAERLHHVSKVNPAVIDIQLGLNDDGSFLAFPNSPSLGSFAYGSEEERSDGGDDDDNNGNDEDDEAAADLAFPRRSSGQLKSY